MLTKQEKSSILKGILLGIVGWPLLAILLAVFG